MANVLKEARRCTTAVDSSGGAIASPNLQLLQLSQTPVVSTQASSAPLHLCGVAAGESVCPIVGTRRLPRTPDDVSTRGACKQIKTSRIVRMTQEKIRVLYNSLSRQATSSRVYSWLVHDIGAIIQSYCSMNTVLLAKHFFK
ncbi:Uncharacterized protein Fot_32232 [Forsythia ovata]|uniref:Uncharacterized protein n=1 Tax=Forsythia ovata TaxID=205694 RepID=A0ABD1T7B9_9LAMI